MRSDISYKKIIFVVSSFMFFVAVITAMGFGYYIITPVKKEAPGEIFIIRGGMTLNEVANRLEERKLITCGPVFKAWARLMGHGRNIKAGEYRLSASMTPLQIIDILTRGVIVVHSVTIPEGFTAKQIGTFLGKKGIVAPHEFISLALNSELPKQYGISAPTLEGYLYPDTYHFGHEIPAISVIDVMVRRFLEVINPFKKRIEELGMTIEEVVTLASMIEKETARADERAVIASVFLNRLKKGIRLASDPTVIYGIKDFNGNLTRKDLGRPTPYNTYVIQGLPPGPIANPGLDSIRAVLYPAHTDYLYFVSKNDGSHFFSKTYKEHKKAVRIYQQKRRKSVIKNGG